MNKEGYKKILWAGIIAVVVIAIGFGIYYLFFYGRPKESPVNGEAKTKEPTEIRVEKSIPEKGVESVIQWDKVELDKSDNLVRKSAEKLSSHPQVDVWLKNPGLIRKFVAVTDNVVDGLSPRSLVSFLAPQERFEVLEKDGSFYIDPNCYDRYNQVADVFASLSAKECVSFYRDLNPLIQEAYIQLGYPSKDFHDTLRLAVVELLETPVVESEIMVERKVVTYKMVDPELENLSPAQKHLLRMGPRNVRKIQAKLREIAQVLGIPESQLPQPVSYSPLKK